MTDQPAPLTRTTHTHNPDGTVTLSLTLPAALLSDLTWVGDNASDAYRRGSDEPDELLFADVVLSPLAALLWRADHVSPVCPDAPLTSGEAAWSASQTPAS